MRQTTKWVLGMTGMAAFVFCLSGSSLAKAAPGDEELEIEEVDEPMIEPECRNAGKPISFDTGSAKLDKKAQSALDEVATWLEVDDERMVQLEGSADKRGNAEMNKVLSERRADAAKEYLLGQGVEPEQVETVAHGEDGDAAKEVEEGAVETPGSGDRTVAVTICDASVEMSEMAGHGRADSGGNASGRTGRARRAVMVTPAPILTPPPPKSDRPPSGIGVEALVGAGAVGFVDGAARSFADTGGTWDARFIFGSRSPIAFEAAYIGSAQGISALGLNTDAVLLGNGAEGALRFNFTRSRIQPYIYGGGGWTRYSVTNTPVATSSLEEHDDVVMVPVGGGVSARIGRGFLLDARGTYRTTFNETIFNAATGSNVSLDSWNATGRLGFEF